MTQDQALAILKTGANVFLTGEPGSGKTHTVNRYVSYLRAHGVEPAITASTGIAATHIGGMTIHSWSGIGIKENLTKRDIDFITESPYLVARIEKTHVLIIDEISMLNGNLFSAVDAVCRAVRHRRDPFGGLQVICVGDFFQLPPVSRDPTRPPFAFQSAAWAELAPKTCYLTEQYRQDDPEFLSLLSAIRSRSFGLDHERHMKSRIIPRDVLPDGITKLFSHNADVDRINSDELAKLSGAVTTFEMMGQGREGLIAGLKRGCLSPEMLALKIGAVVMFTKNNPHAGFVNGTLGTITGFHKENGYPLVRTHRGADIIAEPMEWQVEEDGRVRALITQVPLRLAWAITIHKSQGMSMDAAVMDLSQTFEYGQGYVALSRVRRLSGLYLLGYSERAFLVHPDISVQDELFRTETDAVVAGFAGSSAQELQAKHEQFIIACGGMLTPSAGKKPKGKKTKMKTHEATLALLREGKLIHEIASARSLTEDTIITHVEYLKKKGMVKHDELLPLLRDALMRELPAIHAVFAACDTQNLTPVFLKCEGKYSYDDLRYARLVLE